MDSYWQSWGRFHRGGIWAWSQRWEGFQKQRGLCLPLASAMHTIQGLKAIMPKRTVYGLVSGVGVMRMPSNLRQDLGTMSTMCTSLSFILNWAQRWQQVLSKKIESQKVFHQIICRRDLDREERINSSQMYKCLYLRIPLNSLLKMLRASDIWKCGV